MPMNTPANNQDNTNPLSMGHNMSDKIIDASLAAYPVEPLPNNFTANVMQAIAAESVVNSTRANTTPMNATLANTEVSEAVDPFSWIIAISRQGIRQIAASLYRELGLVLSQVRRVDIMVAASFALLWCVVAASFIWTSRLVTTETNALGELGPVAWLIPLSTLLGGLIALSMLGVYAYLEQRDS